MREWLYPGAKVVALECEWCLADDNLGVAFTVPQPNQILTIRQIIDDGGDEIFLRFDEILNPKGAFFEEARFHYEGFRPLQKRKTSIEIFERMLTPSPREKADA